MKKTKKNKTKQNKTKQNIAIKRVNIYISLTLLETVTSIKRGGLKLVLLAKTKIKYNICSWNKSIHNVLLFIYNDIIKNPNNYFLVFCLI